MVENVALVSLYMASLENSKRPMYTVYCINTMQRFILKT